MEGSESETWAISGFPDHRWQQFSQATLRRIEKAFLSLLLRRNSGLYGEKLLGSYGQQGGQPQSCHWNGHVTLKMATA